MSAWIGVDLDGTLAMYTGWKGELHIGEPIPEMVQKVKRFIREGTQVKIFTARVGRQGKVVASKEEIVTCIQDWCFEHIGYRLEVTNEKDFSMITLYDDRCHQIITNTGFTTLEYLKMFGVKDD